MQSKLLIVVFLSCFLFQCVISARHPSFAQWKSELGKNYASHVEEQYRAYIYAKNVERIELNNNDASLTHKEAVNRFTDITEEEFKFTYLTYVPLAGSSDDDHPIVGGSDDDHPIVGGDDDHPIVGGDDDHPIVGGSDDDHPIVGGDDDHPIVGKQGENLIITSQRDEVDSRGDDHSKTPINWGQIYPDILVEDQGSCGSCYAFTAMTIASFAAKMQYNDTQVFSKQEIVDCSSSFGNHGCNGGNMVFAYNYGKKYNIQNESTYPYTQAEGNCTRDDNNVTGKYQIASYKTYKGCKSLLNQIKKSPLAVAVDATNWSSYSSGVLRKCGKNVNHAVTLIGLTAKGEWRVQNSWGTSWGEKGYITLAPENTCGICNYSGSFVTLAA